MSVEGHVPLPTVVEDVQWTGDNEDTLLKLLEEKNKLLEKDKRALTRIVSKEDMEAQDRTSVSSITESIGESLQESPTLSKKTTDEEMWDLWGTMLRDWEESSRKKTKLIRQMVQRGIPEHMRGMAWMCLSGSHNRELRDKYPKLLTEVSPFEKQIVRDLARTFPEHSFFKERNGLGQESLLNVLKAYSVYDREVGYCQGSPFIVGVLLMQQIPEEEVFCLFIRLMEQYKLREVFKPSMADLGLYFYQLERLVEELLPQLYLHFQAVGCQTSIYASPWFLTLFASSLPLNVAFRIMDIYFLDGTEIIFRIAIAVLEHHSTALIQLDLEDSIKFFQKKLKPAHESNPDNLIEAALKVKYNTRKMKRWEKDYIARRERVTQDSDEILKLRSDNGRLGTRISALEKECAHLADKLIQGQVDRAQEAEERFTLRNEVAVLKRVLSKPSVPREASEGSSQTNGEVGELLEECSGSGDGSFSDVDVDGGKELITDIIELDQESTSHSGAKQVQPATRLSSVERELMAAKEEITDAAEQLEQKRLELREALHREALTQRELQATQLCVQELQKELLTVRLELKQLRSEKGISEGQSSSDPMSPSQAIPVCGGDTELRNHSNDISTVHTDTNAYSQKNDPDRKLAVDWV